MENLIDDARGKLLDAHLAASRVRAQWSALWEALTRREAANAELGRARAAAAKAAADLQIKTLPLDLRALKAVHVNALEAAHDDLRAAKLAMRAAEQTQEAE